MEPDQAAISPQKADPTELAQIRTSLALDRTLLAWNRTALTLMGFGFTLAKFVHDLIDKGMLHGVQPWYPRQVGFSLMGLGVATLIGGAVEYRRLSKKSGLRGTTSAIPVIMTIALVVLSISLIGSLVSEIRP